MSDAKLLTAGIEAPDAEVELSAQDLRELSGPGDNKPAQEPQARTRIVSVAPSAPAPKKLPVSPATRPSVSPLRVATSLLLAVAFVGALYSFVASKHDTDRPMARPQSQVPASAPQETGTPVLFANPFDAKEVFEFPAGTSEAEARDQVAEILMKRAMERQSKFDARVSSNR